MVLLRKSNQTNQSVVGQIYGAPQDTPETRYSPAVCMGARKAIISGNPITTTFQLALRSGKTSQ